MNVTALLAHADDEIMCAGILAKHVDNGDHVTVIIAFSERSQELYDAANVLGINVIECSDNEREIQWSQRWVKHYEPIVLGTRPDKLVSHRSVDNNTSHVPLANIMRTIARKNNLSLWEVDQAIPGGVDSDSPANNVLVDIDAQAMRKYNAMACYQSVLNVNPGWIDAMQHRDLYNGWLLHMSADTHYAEMARAVKTVWL